MSTDYSTGSTAVRVSVPAGFVTAAGGKEIPGSYIFAHYDYLALALIARVQGSPTGTQTVSLVSTDDISPEVTLASITFDPIDGGVANTVYYARVPENLAFISVSNNTSLPGSPISSPGTAGRRRVLKLAHTASAASAGFSYDVEVITTSRHE